MKNTQDPALRSESVNGRISIVIPAYNEEARLPSTIRDIKTFFSKLALDIEVIIVVEKSNDQTLVLAKKSIDNKEGIDSPVRFQLIDNKVHRGKGYAVKTGMEYVTGEYVFFFDADLSIPLTEVLHFVVTLQKHPEIDILIGDRKHEQSEISIQQTFFRQKIGRTFNSLVQKITGLPIKDTQCGFKAFRYDVAKSIFPLLKCDHFAFDVEILLLAKHFDYKLSARPVIWRDVKGSTVNVWSDSLKMLKDLLLIKYRIANMSRPVPAQHSDTIPEKQVS